VGRAIERVGKLRSQIKYDYKNNFFARTLFQINRRRIIDPAPESGRKRMRWVSRFCEGFSFDRLAHLTDEQIEFLLDQYQKDEPGNLFGALEVRTVFL
jgi:siroheme synthase (precorrin-2 oxidase/ferrochelatase)